MRLRATAHSARYTGTFTWTGLAGSSSGDCVLPLHPLPTSTCGRLRDNLCCESLGLSFRRAARDRKQTDRAWSDCLEKYRAGGFKRTHDNFASYQVGSIERFFCKTCGSFVYHVNHAIGIEAVCELRLVQTRRTVSGVHRGLLFALLLTGMLLFLSLASF